MKKIYNPGENEVRALDGIDLDIEKGDLVAIVGHSGSGKSTLMNMIGCLDVPTSGRYWIDGVEGSKMTDNQLADLRNQKLGFIFQDFNLLDTLTAYENIALALSIRNDSPEVIDRAVKNVAEQLDITEILNKYPYQMSGGQKQRVASARAIITSPSLVLADEPTGALDSRAAKLLLERFNMLNRELQATILMVTHDSFTASYASRIIFIKDGKIFHELNRGADDRKTLFNKIIDVVSLLGGDAGDAL